MDAAGKAAQAEIKSIAEHTADELSTAFAAVGFALAVTAEAPMHGRAYVSIEMLRADEAARLIDKLRSWA
ncbi:hypothetical protein [Streptomyces sp. H39-C1]|uniref:hypothetical protein n=1 Tax=Streptomyces sp. H39-C1 TaxID=3004355 RepID=UPI0022AF8CDA|nr:hypothetical protein [Streptomyces sp. H39-C1]MCZ4101703.1 hypothetical protein [Streptomyces sp. H39-C1]